MIRVQSDTKNALDLLTAELSVLRGKPCTLNDAVWHLVTQGAPHIASRVRELSEQRNEERKQ